MKEFISIKEETGQDQEAIFNLNKLAFGREDESHLIDRLRKSSEFIPALSLVAWWQEEIIGHILFTKIKIEGDKPCEALALAPMAVHPDHQRKGIGSKLVAAGLSKAKEIGYTAVVVLGHPDYYPRFGFKRASGWGIRCPFEVPDEAYMALELREGALAGKAGTVKYSPAFNG